MKKITILLVFIFISLSINAQTEPEPSSRDWKTAKKEAKKFQKEGWKVCNGCLSMEEQLARGYVKQRMKLNNSSLSQYVTGYAKAAHEGAEAGSAEIGTQTEAIQAAKVILAGKITSTIGAVITQENAKNKEILLETVEASKTRIIETLNQLQDLVTMYRYGKDTEKGQGVEVSVLWGYNRNEAMNSATEIIKQELKKKAEINMTEVNKLFDAATGKLR
jgi:hypothetical protein